MPRILAQSIAAALTITIAAAGGLAPPALAQPAGQEKAASEGDPAAQRLSHLEEQIVDLQVVVGTLQSLVRRGPVAPSTGGQPGPSGPAGGVGAPGSAAAGDLAMRVDAIETQIRALTSQIEQLSDRLAQTPVSPGGDGALMPQSGPPSIQPNQAAPPFGTTTVTPTKPGASLGPPAAEPGAAFATAPAAIAGAGNGRVAALPLPTGEAKTAYEAAFAHLVQRDYEAAETGFKGFVETYPADALAGNAQYWLGESYYARGRYKDAADAFLLGYRKYQASDKAPDSLYKLGLALSQLGERSAACDTFKELSGKFPNAPDHIRQRAAIEQRRAGC